MALTYMRRSIFTPKIARNKASIKHASTKAVCLRIPFQAITAAHVHVTRGYHVCLRLFERPGAPTSYTKQGSYLHAQVDCHTQNQKNKQKASEKHASTTAVCLRIPFHARIRCSCTCHTGLSCLIVFVRTPERSYVVEKTWLLPTCAGRFHTQNQKKKKSL